MSSKGCRSATILLLFALLTLLYCRAVLFNLQSWSNNDDWDQHFFYNITVYRNLVEFGELPLWNPWYLGGNPQLANPQIQFPTPMMLLDLMLGPFLGIKLKILVHHWIGLVGMYWLSRRLGQSRWAAVLAAGGFMLSSSFALHMFEGHTNFLSMSYMPWLIGFLFLAQRRRVHVVSAAVFLSLMIFQGGIYTTIYTLVLGGLLTLCWSVQEKSFSPVWVLLIVLGFGAGLSAFKTLPTVQLLRENPRATDAGGKGWQKFFGTVREDAESLEITDAAVPMDAAVVGADLSSSPSRKPASKSRWDVVSHLIRIFLGRDQRAGQYYYAHQGYTWDEYGAYTGPIVLGFVALFPMVLRTQWPWLVTAVICFLVALGNFASVAPWTLLHYLPVFSNARVPSRFLMPCVLSISLLAGFVLDAIRAKIGDFSGTGSLRSFLKKHLDLLTTFLLALCFMDLVMVGNHSLAGIFSRRPTEPMPKNENIITVAKMGEVSPMTEAMLANYCTLYGYEPVHIPIHAQHVGHPLYRGEVYFVHDERQTNMEEDSAPIATITHWSPNTVRVRVENAERGRIVVNRNWEDGWKSKPPHKAIFYEGLLAAEVNPGTHEILFYYSPPVVWIGLFVSCVSMVVALVWLLVYWSGSAASQLLG